MNSDQLNILLIDKSEQDYNTIRSLLAGIKSWQTELDWASSYEAAQEKIEESYPDVCLLNYRLDGNVEQVFLQQALANSLKIPLILLAEAKDYNLVVKVIKNNAADYLFKDQVDAALLERSIRYVVRYKDLEESVQQRIDKRTAQLNAKNEKLYKELKRCRREEKRLQESEQQYRMLFNIDIYSVEVLDAQGYVIDCNPTYENLLDYSRDEIIGKHTTHFASTNSKKGFLKKLPHLIEWGYIEGEVELVRRDGTKILVWRRSRALYDDEGNFIGVVSYSRNITERMKAVKQISTLAQALEQNPIAVMITDTDGNVEYVNFSFSELTGYAYEDVIGRNLRSFRPGQLSLTDYEQLWSTIKSGEEWQDELQGLQKDGEVYWESVTIVPMYNPQGAMTHFIVTREDVTSRKEAEAADLMSRRRVGDLMSGHISDLTLSNEKLQREISDRKRAEKALRRSRTRLKAQYKAFPIPTYSWQKVGKDFILVDYNDAAEKTSHGRVSDLMGKAANVVFKDRSQVLADFNRCFNDKTVIKREAVYNLVSTGEARYFVTTYNFVPPNLIVVHIEDITEYKQASEKLEKYEKKLAQLSEGQSASEGNGSNLQEQLEEETGKRETLEEELQEAQERLKHVTSNIDDRLREQYRSIPIPTYSWQRIANEFILIDFNDAAAEMMGKIVDFLGQPASKIFKDRPQVLADFNHCYEEKIHVRREAPYQLVTTGETRYFVSTYDFVPPNLIIGHIQDVTEYKEMEAELKKYQQKFGEISPDEMISVETKAALEEEYQQQVTQVTMELNAQLEEVEKELEQVIHERKRLEESLSRTRQDLNEIRANFDGMVKDRTSELTKKNEQLEKELVKHERAEETLRQSRARLRSQYKSIPIPTYSWQKVGKDFVLVDYNHAAENNTNGRIIEFMGKTATEAFKNRPEILNGFAQCFSKKSTIRKEGPHHLLSTDENKHFVSTYNFVPPNMVIVYIQDITRYKQAEKFLYTGLREIELTCRFSANAALTFVNDAYCWYFNRNREDLIDQTLPFVLEEDSERVQAHFISLSVDNPIGCIEYRVVRPEGDVRWQQWINRAIFDQNQQLIEIQSIGRDITHRKI